MTRKFAAIAASAAAAATFGLGWGLVTAPDAGAGPECTNAQPYPDSPYDICVGYGQTCAKFRCASPPGTPGKWDVNGDYTPCTQQYGC
jgi:hypothetical protein